MAAVVSHSGQSDTGSPLSAQQALRYAWYGYLVLLAAPFLMFLIVAWTLMGQSMLDRGPWVDGWFLGAVAYMVLVVPASFFLRSRYFSDYWKGKSVRPDAYLKGMFTVWIALEIGGLFSLSGCLVSKRMLPSLMPALAAFMMFAILWPSGRAMVSAQRGASDDPEKYEEPR